MRKARVEMERPRDSRPPRGQEGKKLPRVDLRMLRTAFSRRKRTAEAVQAEEIAAAQAALVDLTLTVTGEAAFQRGRRSGRQEVGEAAIAAVNEAYQAGSNLVTMIFDHGWVQPRPTDSTGEPDIHRSGAEVIAEATQALAARNGDGALPPGDGETGFGFALPDRKQPGYGEV